MGRAVVIGAGFGGLAAAVRLRRMGWEVTVLEALDQPGGRARVFHRDGFTFDAGPTVITAPHLIAELFELVGRDPRDYYATVPVDPFYRILFDDGSTLDYTGDEERLLEQIARFDARDVDGYRQLARMAERIFDVGFTQLADQPFDRLSDMLRVLPAMLRLQSWRSVHGLVARYIHDPRLRQAFTFEPLLVGGNPFRTPSIYLLIHWLERKWGVHFAMGGTTTVVHALVRLLEELDVEVRLNAPVEEIILDRGRVSAVVTADGTRLPCELVVSNADPSYVYSRMLAPTSRRRRHTPQSVSRVRQSMSLFVGYFGTRRTYPDLAHHTILLGPRYEGLLNDIFQQRPLARDFSLYLHAPTRTDPSLAPPGCETFYVLSPVPNLRAGIDWTREGEPYFARLRESLQRRLLPGLDSELATSFHMTPLDFEQTLRSVDGAAFGPEPVLTQSAWFRYHNRSPDVDGLYFVGAGTHPGGGIPGVLSSARVLERVVPRPAHPRGERSASAALAARG